LSTVKPLEPLFDNEFLSKACQDHLEGTLLKADKPAQLSSKGKDGTIYKDRIERHCQWGGGIFEALDFAPRFDAQDVVVAWLVDDGNKKRTH
jgi:hypothetical protein